MIARHSLVFALVATTWIQALAAPPPTAEQIRSWIIAEPRPDYPEDARARGATGEGFFKLHFVIKTGRVRFVQILKSTGDKALDAAAVAALKHWRFKAGVLPSVRTYAKDPAKEPFAGEDFVIKVPMAFAINGKVQTGGALGSAR